MTVISARDIRFQYTATAPVLQAINLALDTGQTLGLLGANGAGKSTLIALMTGRLALQQGELTLWGMDFKHRRNDLLKRIALVPQGYAFYPSLSVYENMQFFAQLRVDLDAWRPRVEAALDFCQLTPHRHQRAQQLSGGLKRRLNLAIGLVNRPQLLFLDEPTVGIDPISKDFILKAIEELKQQGLTLVYTSHHMEEVDRLCDQVAILDQGRILYQGRLTSLSAQLGQAIRARVSFDAAPSAAWLAWLTQVGLTYRAPWVEGKLTCSPDAFLAEFQAGVHQQQGRITECYIGPMSMEAAFFEMLANAPEQVACA
ncbi:MAG: ABC transporter ATP-binding protein [Thiomicrospira sp.]|nr:ABC transporter ATP-binding protein [Thiomicrospira sp.]